MYVYEVIHKEILVNIKLIIYIMLFKPQFILFTILFYLFIVIINNTIS